MLTLHYYSNSESVRAALRQVTFAWWSQDDDPVYSKDLIKEFEMENPPLEDELAWILSKGIGRDHQVVISRKPEDGLYVLHTTKFHNTLVFGYLLIRL